MDDVVFSEQSRLVQKKNLWDSFWFSYGDEREGVKTNGRYIYALIVRKLIFCISKWDSTGYFWARYIDNILASGMTQPSHIEMIVIR